MSELFEQVANIAKAHNADIYAKQVQELKECNKELILTIERLLEREDYSLTSNTAYGNNRLNRLIADAKNIINKAKILSL